MNRNRLSPLLILLLLVGAIIGVSVLVQQESNLRGPLATIAGFLAVLVLAASVINDVPGAYNILRRLWQKLLGQDPDAHPTPKPESRVAQRNRHTILLKVKAFWIDGVLANSLHSKIIPLDMEHKPDAVTRPRLMDIHYQPKDQPPQPVPPGTRLITLFNHAAGDALLILGDPGSGKTTLLLELARDLLAWAEQNNDRRIPVIFNLSTWATHQPPLVDWLTTELQTLYLIPHKVAQTWVGQDDILPLLDGLDEVAAEHRSACIQAINTYRQAQGTPLVVCSRLADYKAIGTKLLLSDALLLKSLTPAQIDAYLSSGGRALDGVRLVLQQDEVFQEMAQSPLLLSLMVLTYRNQPPEQFTSTDPADRRRQLFATYIQRQLPQRRRDQAEDPATTLHQLSYLAHQMTTHEQTIFLIERLRVDWLPSLNPYNWTIGLVLGLLGGLYGGLFGGLYWGLQGGIVLGLILGWVLGRFGATHDELSKDFHELFVVDFFADEKSGLVIMLREIFDVPNDTKMVFRSPPLFGGLDDIGLVEKVNWSWRADKSDELLPAELLLELGFIFLVVNSILWIAIGLIIELVNWLFGWPNFEFGVSLFSVLLGGFCLGLLGLGVSLLGILIQRIDIRPVRLTNPNEGITNLVHYVVRVGLGTGLLGWLIVGVAFGWKLGVVFGVAYGLFSALGVVGGMAVIQHYTLRFWLHRYGYLPLRLVPFLDLAAERLILQKVGGGYRFVHRLLQEYLASLYEGEGVVVAAGVACARKHTDTYQKSPESPGL